MSFGHILGKLTNIHIPKFNLAIGSHKNIRTLQIPVQDPQLMQGLQPPNNLNKNAPQLLLRKLGIIFNMRGDLGVQIPTVGQFHHDVEEVG